MSEFYYPMYSNKKKPSWSYNKILYDRPQYILDISVIPKSMGIKDLFSILTMRVLAVLEEFIEAVYCLPLIYKL